MVEYPPFHQRKVTPPQINKKKMLYTHSLKTSSKKHKRALIKAKSPLTHHVFKNVTKRNQRNEEKSIWYARDRRKSGFQIEASNSDFQCICGGKHLLLE